ncbi:MAG TPA: hypothetical protein GX708_04880 [Gallicola sp.]|nr:hypothetical protein [Gallicola sp.]
MTFEIKPAVGDLSLIPKARNYKLEFYNLDKYSLESAIVNGKNIKLDIEDSFISLAGVDSGKGAKLVFKLKEDAE